MIPLNISLENSNGVTVVSNLFVDKYMGNANDAEIKIYLYLLRMISAGLPTDISEMADKFNYTEKDVEKSLKFWEKQGLFALQYSGTKVSGLILKDINNAENQGSQMIVTEKPDSHEIPMIKMDYDKEKNSYSIEDISRIKSEPEVKMLVNVAQEYFKIPMNPAAIRTIVFIYDRLAFSFELIDFLIERCVEDGNKSIHYLETLAKFLYEQGIKDTEEAKKAIDKVVPSYVPRVLSYLGIKSEPIKEQTNFIKRWILEYGFSLEIIEQACTKAVLGGKTDKFGYVDVVLSDWKENNIHSLNDLEAYNQKYAEGKQKKAEAKAEQKKTYGPTYSSNANSQKSDFCSMKKRDYDFDAMLKAARVN